MWKACLIHFYAEADSLEEIRRSPTSVLAEAPVGERNAALQCYFPDSSTYAQPHDWLHDNRWLYTSNNPMKLVTNGRLREQWKKLYVFNYTAHSGRTVSYLTVIKGMSFCFEYRPHCIHTERAFFSTYCSINLYGRQNRDIKVTVLISAKNIFM